MTSRMIAIGDIHGCSLALSALLNAICPEQGDVIVTLGDYVDRGLDSKGAIDQLIDLKSVCTVVSILGNHDEMMLRSRTDKNAFREWMNYGGISALDSYGETGDMRLIPSTHIHFLETCVSYFETDTHFFVHANYRPDLPLSEQDERTLRWLSLKDVVPGPHMSGKIAVLGHTTQKQVLDLGYLLCIDTACYENGWLTAIDVATKKLWQANEAGQMKEVI